jgi:alkanesulfonate monooxygenase SsuD/methylene tetrahydromethanopterin reductase-like flavin-dependent oxidoreductase (luciferase family)
MGAGWQEREHAHYGWDLLDVPGRLDRFEEALEIVTHLLGDDQPVDYDGKYYRLEEAVLLPRPARAGGPPIAIGGNGTKRTLPLAARFAAEWNGVFLTADRFAELNQLLDRYLIAVDRRPEDMRRSLMVGTVIGRYEDELARKLADERSWWHGREPEELRQHGVVVGIPEQYREQLAEYARAGVQRIMLQWLDLDDLEGLEALALELL